MKLHHLTHAVLLGVLTQVRSNLCPEDATCLRQAHFATGTVIIDTAGLYKLCEDITFSPNPPPGNSQLREGDFEPVFDGFYDEHAYGLGFFSAIAITVPNVELYLCGRTIEQSAEHALMQRFFAVIELANSPFIPSAGPAQFVGADGFIPASNVKIHGPGIIGRSSHHGIHGNENNNIVIKDVTFRDFEVAAASLNNINSLVIEDCEITQNRHDVPVVGLFSAATFILPYGRALMDSNPGYVINLRGQTTRVSDVHGALLQAIKNVYNEVKNGGEINQKAFPDEFKLFDNPKRVVDGPCYAFVVHGKGPAVGGVGFSLLDPEEMSSDITIRNNVINNIRCWTNEVPAAVVAEQGAHGNVANDARGAVFQFVNSMTGDALAIKRDGTYMGNVVADMQIMVAKAIHDGVLTDTPLLQTGVNTISATLIDWATSDSATFTPSYRCNGDSMHHVSKGMTIIRVEDTAGFRISGNTIDNVENLSPQPFGTCTDYHGGASVENVGEQQGGNVRGISVAAVDGYDTRWKTQSKIVNNQITNFRSETPGFVCGIDVQGESRMVSINFNDVDLSPNAGRNPNDEFIALRVRENADAKGQDAIHVGPSNDFSEEVQILNRRGLRNDAAMAEMSKEMLKDVKTEYDLGGCPFARAKGQKAKPT